MTAASEALDSERSKRPVLIGVTVLTSMERNDLYEVGVNEDVQEHVSRLAKLAYNSGLDGVVCSAAETKMLRVSMPSEFKLVTPGIRRPQDVTGDQKRVFGPAEAIRNGSDYLVIGRPLTEANSPLEALIDFNSEITQL